MADSAEDLTRGRRLIGEIDGSDATGRWLCPIAGSRLREILGRYARVGRCELRLTDLSGQPRQVAAADRDGREWSLQSTARRPVEVLGQAVAQVEVAGPPEAKATLEGLGELAAAAVADAWHAALEIDSLAGEIVHNYEELHLLYELGEALTTQLGATAAADLILGKILNVLEASRAALYLEGMGEPLAVSRVEPPEQIDLPGDPAHQLATNLRSGGHLIGRIEIVRPASARPFSSAEHKLLDAVGTLAGNAVRNSQLYEHLKLQIEESRRTQAQLVQSAKLAAIGELAANIAHEINNPLTGILMNVSLALEAVEELEGAGIQPELTVIQEEALRARGIVRNLLDFARQTEPRPEPVNLNTVIEQTLSLVDRYLQSSSVRVTRDFQSNLPLLTADLNQLKQVFLNLINNAVQAMPHGGDLRLTTRVEEGQVAVYVQDTGAGIPSEHLPRIFEPFFSTKEEVKGTGLGLSVSHGIVAKHHGTIQVVASEVGVGTTFRVALAGTPA